MRADKKDKKRSHIASSILGIIYVVVLSLFLVTIMKINILPVKYFVILVAIVSVVSMVVLKLLLSRKLVSTKDGDLRRPKSKYMSSIIALIMIVVMGFGTFYMAGTLDFFGKISGDAHYQTFYVVVNADSSYEKINDAEGETLGVMTVSDDIYEEAKVKLRDKVDVSFKKAGDYRSTTTSLKKGEYNAIFLNSTYYEMALEEVEGFSAENTKIIYEVEIKTEVEVLTKPVEVTQDAFNVYVSGIDTDGSISNISRTDVNMIMTINPKTRTVLLTSIPRDCYVKLASKGQMDKLTHSGLYGINETTETVENLLGVEINYYVRVNFTTLIKLVDALGGIEVESDYTFSRKGFNYVAGMNYMDGAKALTFARERYSFGSGDNQRVKNQQAVIKGIINKATGSTAILTNYNSILNSLEGNLQTSMQQKDITSLVKMQLADMRGWTIQQQSISGVGKSTPVYSMPNSYVYVMVPNQDSIDAATSKIVDVMSAE